MTFVSRKKVRFALAGAAGVMVNSRFFERVNAAVEDGFDSRRGMGVETMHLERRFQAAITIVGMEIDRRIQSLGQTICTRKLL